MYFARRFPVLCHLSRIGEGWAYRGISTRGVQGTSSKSTKKSVSAKDLYEASEVGDEEDVYFPREERTPKPKKGKRELSQDTDKWANVWRKQDLDNNNDTTSSNKKTSQDSTSSSSSSSSSSSFDEQASKGGWRTENREDNDSWGNTSNKKDRGWKGGADRYKNTWKDQRVQEKKSEQTAEKKKSGGWRMNANNKEQEEEIRRRLEAERKAQAVPRKYIHDEDGDEDNYPDDNVRIKPSDLYPPGKAPFRNDRRREDNNASTRTSDRENSTLRRKGNSVREEAEGGLKAEDYFDFAPRSSSSSPSSSSTSSSSPRGPSSFSSGYFLSDDSSTTKFPRDQKNSFRENDGGKKPLPYSASSPSSSSSSSSSSSALSTTSREGRMLTKENKQRSNITRKNDIDSEPEEIPVGKSSWLSGEGKVYNEETGRMEKIRWGTSRRPRLGENEIDEQTAWENKVGRRFGKKMTHQIELLEDLNENDDFFSADDDPLPPPSRRPKRTTSSSRKVITTTTTAEQQPTDDREEEKRDAVIREKPAKPKSPRKKFRVLEESDDESVEDPPKNTTSTKTTIQELALDSKTSSQTNDNEENKLTIHASEPQAESSNLSSSETNETSTNQELALDSETSFQTSDNENKFTTHASEPQTESSNLSSSETNLSSSETNVATSTTNDPETEQQAQPPIASQLGEMTATNNTHDDTSEQPSSSGSTSIPPTSSTGGLT